VLLALQEWRDEAARVARVSPEAVIDDQLLATIAATQPADQDELAAIAGVGQVLATSRIGEGVLAALAAPGHANSRSA